MFGAEQFAMMKDGVRLVNTARGGIYQIDALAEALASRQGRSARPSTSSRSSRAPTRRSSSSTTSSSRRTSARPPRRRRTAPASRSPSSSPPGLRGEMVPTAVNIAPVPPEVMEKVGPYIALAEDLGKMVAQLARGGVEALDILIVGGLADIDTRILRPPCSRACSRVVTAESVNFVNADYYAEQRGITVTETKRAETHDYVSHAHRARATPATEPVEIGRGAHRQEERAAARVAVRLRPGHAARAVHGVLPLRGPPGMIGKVGTITRRRRASTSASMQVGRHEAGGTGAHGHHRRHARARRACSTRIVRRGRHGGRVERGAVGREPAGRVGRRPQPTHLNGATMSENASTAADRVHIFDTTLRDGEQSPGASMNTDEKLEIARQLVRLGRRRHRGRLPDLEPRRLRERAPHRRRGGRRGGRVRRSRAPCPRTSRSAADALSTAARPRIHTGIGVSESHLRDKLRITPRARRSSARSRRCKLARTFVDDVEFYAEDAGRAEPGVPLPDGRGGRSRPARPSSTSPTPPATRIPRSSARSSRGLMENVAGIEDVTVSVHCHNDLGMATANALAGVQRGRAAGRVHDQRHRRARGQHRRWRRS